MTEEEINAVLIDAGLSEVMEVYHSAIEINLYEKIGNAYANGNLALATLIKHVRNAALNEAAQVARKNSSDYSGEYPIAHTIALEIEKRKTP